MEIAERIIRISKTLVCTPPPNISTLIQFHLELEAMETKALQASDTAAAELIGRAASLIEGVILRDQADRAAALKEAAKLLAAAYMGDLRPVASSR